MRIDTSLPNAGYPAPYSVLTQHRLLRSWRSRRFAHLRTPQTTVRFRLGGGSRSSTTCNFVQPSPSADARARTRNAAQPSSARIRAVLVAAKSTSGIRWHGAACCRRQSVACPFAQVICGSPSIDAEPSCLKSKLASVPLRCHTSRDDRRHPPISSLCLYSSSSSSRRRRSFGRRSRSSSSSSW